MFHDDSFADIAVDLEKTMPLKGDKAKSTVCFAYQSGSCLKGDRCPHKHTITHRSRVQEEVCKYWLRGLCKMGEDCEFLHEHIASKIPECFFYQGFGECSNPECVFRHNSMDEAIPECQAYRRGFCRYGPKCRLRHVKRDACPNYMAGLCIDGPDCRMGHPSTLYITEDGIRDRLSKRRAIVEGGVRSYVFTSSVNCSVCGCNGHGAAQCSQNATRVAEIKRDIMRKYEEPEGIGCYHCKTEGHLSNDCTKKKERYMQHRHRDEPAESLIPGVQGTRADLNQEAERARPRCHRCGEEGHIVRDCPLAKAEQAQGKAAPGQRVITCYHCQEPGHIAMHCPKRAGGGGRGFGGFNRESNGTSNDNNDSSSARYPSARPGFGGSSGGAPASFSGGGRGYGAPNPPSGGAPPPRGPPLPSGPPPSSGPPMPSGPPPPSGAPPAYFGGNTSAPPLPPGGYPAGSSL